MRTCTPDTDISQFDYGHDLYIAGDATVAHIGDHWSLDVGGKHPVLAHRAEVDEDAGDGKHPDQVYRAAVWRMKSIFLFFCSSGSLIRLPSCWAYSEIGSDSDRSAACGIHEGLSI